MIKKIVLSGGIFSFIILFAYILLHQPAPARSLTPALRPLISTEITFTARWPRPGPRR